MKKLSKKEILTNAKKRLKEMEFDIAFYTNINDKFPTERTRNKIELLKEDVEVLRNQIRIFMEGGNI